MRSPVRRPNSEPPPHSLRSRMENDNMSLPMHLSVQHITDKLKDDSLSNKQRIESMQNVVKYLHKCHRKMRECMGQIGVQCNNFIRCVEGIIEDLRENS